MGLVVVVLYQILTHMTDMLTQDLLNELFLIEDGKLIARFDGMNRKAGQVVGSPSGLDGSWVVFVNGKRYRRSRLIFCMVHGFLPKGQIDHKNRDASDDRPENLRIATGSQNSANQKDRPRKHDLPRGVWMCHGRYQTRVTVKHKPISLGTYDTPEEAHQAYRAGLKRYFGEFSPYASVE